MGERNPAVRFWRNVAKCDERDDLCWLWLGHHDGRYGKMSVGGVNTTAHRVGFKLLRGPVPDDLTVDHLCRNTICVNPAHMEVVTSVENVMRGASGPASNARKTRCIHGHEFSAANTYVAPDGHRSCRTCWRVRWARIRESEKARKR